MKRIFEMSADEIVTQFILDRGSDPKDPKLRNDYPITTVLKAKDGDFRALVELLRIGTFRTPGREFH